MEHFFPALLDFESHFNTILLYRYQEFLQLCEHVECIFSQMSLNETTDTKPRENHLEDDLRLRSLRDANRSPSPEKRPPIISTRGHYLWQNRSDRKYKSQIHPMKTPDVVRYDFK